MKSPFYKTGWIQDVTKDIKKRGTEGVCTYNLAKTFKSMSKNK